MDRPKSAEDYILSQTQWREILSYLREIILNTELKETIKWGIPTYTINNKNVVGLAAFKPYAGLWFFNGVYLRDENNFLVNAQEGSTKAQRQWRFTDIKSIDPELVKAYLEEAIQNQKDGRELKPEKKKIIESKILNEALSKQAKLKFNFEKFSTAKQQEFVRYLNEAKREETKLKRLEKIIPLIHNHTGLNDQYKH
tara:strand:- start:4812 stop:5402 length:591 start_codon:yes stop_codon:yes gene_type:complete